ncbi:MAG: hypothetical protein JWN03_3827 [Nocardia sp.]|nr:hypothetical protein [Nocardia sp.]
MGAARYPLSQDFSRHLQKRQCSRLVRNDMKIGMNTEAHIVGI